MDTHLVAVGVPVGQTPVAGTSGTQDPAFFFRVGSAWVALDQSSTRLWQAALNPTTEARLHELAGSDTDVAELMSTGLLVPGWEGNTASSAFLDLRPIPLSVGKGPASADDPLSTVCDWRGGELVRLNRIDYEMWAQLDGRRTITQAVSAAASTLHSEPSAILERVPLLFTALLGSRAIALDAA